MSGRIALFFAGVAVVVAGVVLGHAVQSVDGVDCGTGWHPSADAMVGPYLNPSDTRCATPLSEARRKANLTVGAGVVLIGVGGVWFMRGRDNDDAPPDDLGREDRAVV